MSVYWTNTHIPTSEFHYRAWVTIFLIIRPNCKASNEFLVGFGCFWIVAFNYEGLCNFFNY